MQAQRRSNLVKIGKRPVLKVHSHSFKHQLKTGVSQVSCSKIVDHYFLLPLLSHCTTTYLVLLCSITPSLFNILLQAQMDIKPLIYQRLAFFIIKNGHPILCQTKRRITPQRTAEARARPSNQRRPSRESMLSTCNSYKFYHILDFIWASSRVQSRLLDLKEQASFIAPVDALESKPAENIFSQLTVLLLL
ncbi:hypothetical protein BCR41DRAFT_410967 [Lobosporangium transversale]|uniref:Uncharacterized protein n=1 Tax=Lobosporangium transversale TaxID=64571 RepID=A0A1Y2GEU6_9FUNG|nr:hypothetical protein BCR41DRAFT_410967 [Lobosporangium transversale]ORZ08810.1 hypothetical protein BCR41DRAFT_410967 [Lobosporangium transversale]|eukprot:XP_021878593.1 hypothetical protein BCR41DRAFT_410967 [Lobosporangium transversale]